jgi:hypothetical protein
MTEIASREGGLSPILEWLSYAGVLASQHLLSNEIEGGTRGLRFGLGLLARSPNPSGMNTESSSRVCCLTGVRNGGGLISRRISS